jgi:Helicase HerA, central domain/TraM recognition site of TraD and TraG
MKASDILGALEGDKTHSGTHMHVLGSTGVGKSYFLEFILREAILSQRGFCFIDWHGTTYNRLLNYLTHIRPLRDIVLLNPSAPDYVVGFNPFIDPGEDITTTVARRIDSTIKPWGAKDTNQTPTLERNARTAYHFAVRAGETLPNTSHILRFTHRYLLDYALSILTEPEDESVREEVEELKLWKTPQQWSGAVLSTKNRFARFIGHSGLQTFLGLKTGNINVRELVDRNAIILVNLARSGYLDTEPARVFASLLLNEFREVAMRRAGTKKHFFLALDEFQEYVTFDLAAMLDETRKGGFHLILAHQRLGHLRDDEELRDAVFSNCQVKAVFGGLRYESAAIMANEMHLDRINERDVKETYYGQQVAGFNVEEYSTQSDTESYRGEADDPSGLSVTSGKGRTVTPIYRESVTSRAEWSRDEKVSRLAQQLREQPRQSTTIKLRESEAESFDVPTLKDYSQGTASIQTYSERIYRALSALPFAEARLTVQKSRDEFLNRAGRKQQGTPARRKQQVPPASNKPVIR